LCNYAVCPHGKVYRNDDVVCIDDEQYELLHYAVTFFGDFWAWLDTPYEKSAQAQKPDKPEACNERVYAEYLVVDNIKDAFMCLFVKAKMYPHRVWQTVIPDNEPHQSYQKRDKTQQQDNDMRAL
jgi:hypothetical protein